MKAASGRFEWPYSEQVGLLPGGMSLTGHFIGRLEVLNRKSDVRPTSWKIFCRAGWAATPR